VRADDEVNDGKGGRSSSTGCPGKARQPIGVEPGIVIAANADVIAI